MYEIEQIAQVLLYLEQKKIPLDTCTIIPLEFDVERALQERDIPYESLLKYIPLEEEFADVIMAARRASRLLNEHSSMQFYAYQNINMAEVFEPMLDMYLEFLGRYINIFARIVAVSGADTLVVPYTPQLVPPKASAFTLFEYLSPVDAARAVGRSKGITVQTIGSPPRLADKKESFVRLLASLGLAFYNACIRTCIRPRSLKIYASEYWSHISSFIEQMNDVELILMERSEIKNIPWRQLLKHRIRFEHPSDAINAETEQRISRAAADFTTKWHSMKDDVKSIFNIVPGIDSWTEIEQALTYVIETRTTQALTDIEGLRHIMREEQPDKVLLRASIGGTLQHFFIATKVAHQLKIPSIELQHAGAIFDPRSEHSRLAASYLAAYGSLERNIFQENHGYAPDRIRPIGSPRFDHYVHERDSLAQNRTECLAEMGLDPARPTVFAAVPYAGAFALAFSSYQVADFFKVFRNAQREIPELQFIFKFRPGDFSPFYQKYIGELFTDGGAVSTNMKNFLPLIMASDIACTGRSTVMYEIMLGGRPVILFPWQKWDTYALDAYKRAVPAALDEKELITLLRQLLNKNESKKAVERQNTFLSENCRFDGHAPERMTALLREKLLPLP